MAAILVFVGIKMVIVDLWHVPIALSLAVIATVPALSVVASLRATRTRQVQPQTETEGEMIDELPR